MREETSMERNEMRTPVNEDNLMRLIKQLPAKERELIVRQAYGMATMAKLLEGENRSA